MKTRPYRPKRRYHYWTEKKVRDLRYSCLDRHEMARKMGVSVNMVSIHLRKHNLPVWTKQGRPSKYNRNELLLLWNECETISDVAKRLRISYSTARSLLSRYRLPKKKSAAYLKHQKHAVEIMRRLNHGETENDIGKDTGITRQAVSSVINGQKYAAKRKRVFYDPTCYPLKEALLDLVGYEHSAERH